MNEQRSHKRENTPTFALMGYLFSEFLFWLGALQTERGDRQEYPCVPLAQYLAEMADFMLSRNPRILNTYGTLYSYHKRME